ncbi:MAG: carboxynorspermidine decarboxylase [Myxococcota bacterium]
MKTPYYLIEEERMLAAMEIIGRVQERSGARSVLALKCFAAWCAFDFMARYMAGTTSSSPYEARLGKEYFGGETHGYSVAFDDDEFAEVVRYCDKIIFNSLSQLERHAPTAGEISLGLRLNPEIGCSRYPLSNPVGEYSRLGVRAQRLPKGIGDRIDGAMTHVNCENDDAGSFCAQVDHIEARFAGLLPHLRWFSFGGGIAFTDEGYDLDLFCERLRAFATEHHLQVYLEPGEASVRDSTSLVVTVIDIVDNGVPTLIVDAGVETHLLDVLVYDFTPQLRGARTLSRDGVGLADLDGHVYRVCGRTCLAGDHFGNFLFARPVSVGQELTFPNVGGYSIVKKNHFNGIRMPAIYHRALSGELRLAHQPTYEDFRDALTRPTTPLRPIPT